MVRLNTYIFFLLFVTSIYSQNVFISKWETTNRNEVIEFTIHTDDTSFSIDWGDGTVTTESSTNLSHSYNRSGIYSIAIDANLQRVDFANKKNLLEIVQWGSSKWNSFEFSFRNCSKLKITASDVPDLSTVKSMIGTFSGASSFDQNIGNWNVSNVTNMALMFSGATSFDQNLESWDVSKVANMNFMFKDVNLSTFHYDALLIGWSKLNLQRGVVFDAGDSRYCSGESARQKIIDTHKWIIRDNRKNCEILNVDDHLSQEIVTYPNPVTSEMKVTGTLDIEKMSIFGITGNLIGSSHRNTIDMSYLPEGFYLVVIETNEGNIWKEVLKQ